MRPLEDPRARYIAFATPVFASLGYKGASLSTLSRDAGVSKQALLHFFGSKHQLYAEVLAALGDRLQDDIATSERSDAAAHLARYFESMLRSAREDPQDLHLVVRALLDAEETARTWPLKPYLDALFALVRRTEGGADKSDAMILAWMSQMIGMIQYLAIAAPTLAGIYGPATARDVGEAYRDLVEAEVRRFTKASV